MCVKWLRTTGLRVGVAEYERLRYKSIAYSVNYAHSLQ